jgi:hypothetical protein
LQTPIRRGLFLLSLLRLGEGEGEGDGGVVASSLCIQEEPALAFISSSQIISAAINNQGTPIPP